MAVRSKLQKGYKPSWSGVSTSISGQAWLVLIGMTLEGDFVFAEIMFGDFIVVNGSIDKQCLKFHHMYGKQISCNVTVRTLWEVDECYEHSQV